MNDFIRDSIVKVFSGLTGKLSDFTKLITQSPEDAFGSSFWSMLLNLGTSIIMPLAIVMLCYFMTAELYQVYCKANGELDLQLVSTTFFKFTLPFLIILKTYDLLEILFNQISRVVSRMSAKINFDIINGTGTQNNDWYNQINGMSFLDKMAYWIQLQPLAMLMNGMGIVIMIIVYGRLFEIMMYWIFSPIPFATLVNHEHSQIGKNFLKLFAAVLLQGGFIVLCIIIYLALIQTVSVQANMDGAWQMLGYSGLLIYMLTKTGTMSKKLLATF